MRANRFRPHFEDARALAIVAASALAGISLVAVVMFATRSSSEAPEAPWVVSEVVNVTEVGHPLRGDGLPRLLNGSEIGRLSGQAYPRLLRDAGIGGTVRLSFSVDEEGQVRAASVATSSGHASLDVAALSLAPSYRFEPALDGGEPVAAEFEVPITFQVRGRAISFSPSSSVNSTRVEVEDGSVSLSTTGHVRLGREDFVLDEGFDASPIIYLDGIRVDMDIQTSTFSMQDIMSTLDIESVEVIRGSQAVELYGAEASDGVILLTAAKRDNG